MSKLSRIIIILALLLGGVVFVEWNSNAYAAEFDSETNKKVKNLKKLKIPDEGGNKQETKEKSWKKHNHAIKIVKQYYENQGITVSGDFDDIKYQEQVKTLGLAVFSFKKSEQDAVSEYIKFMDLYENYEQNEQIDELINKFEKEVITDEELSLLFDLGVTEESETLDVPVSEEEMIVHLEEEYIPNNLATVSSVDMPEDDQTPVTDPTTEDDPDAIDNNAGTSANTYYPLKARDYAYKWTSNTANLRNNASYGYYSKNSGGCHDCWWDCTNFISQALAAGGMKYVGGVGSGYVWSTNWYYASGSNKPTFSWGGANAFYKHFKDRARVASKVAYLRTGDVVSLDTGGDSKIDHNVMITKNWGNLSSQKYYTAHQSDTKEEYTLARLYQQGYKVYGIEMDKASN
ncbi:amidase domain-containing protein [Planococcus kocurii]|uniref:amidase domain-containing protein n=1 Tax=Planococcus kocurii TaxID=1374 RepID=UPI003D04909C